MFTKYIDFLNEKNSPKRKIHRYLGVIYLGDRDQFKTWTNGAEYTDVGSVENAIRIEKEIQLTGKYKGKDVAQCNIFSIEDLNSYHIPLKMVIPYPYISDKL